MGLSAFLMPAILNIETNRQRLTLETKAVAAPGAETTSPAASAESTIG
jgi:hypothetical protein